jgi:signal transduction histidine kinase
MVHGISDRLKEVFVILLDNAIKYSPEKSNIKIISDVYNKTDLKEQKNATLSNSLQRLYKKTDVDLSNIIEGKRQKKKIVKLDL